MNKPGLIISLAMLFAWLKGNKIAEEKQAYDVIDLPDLDNFGIDYHSTPMPDDLKIKTTLRVTKISSDKCSIKVYLYLTRNPGNRTKPIYIHRIKINTSLFGKYLSYFNKYTHDESNHILYSDYEILYFPSIPLQYNSYGRMFGIGDVILSKEELQQIKDAIAGGKKEIQPFAKVDVQIEWSDLQNGDVENVSSKRWNNGIAQQIESILMKE